MHAPSSATQALPMPGSSATAAAAMDDAVTRSSSLAYLENEWGGAMYALNDEIVVCTCACR